MRTTTQRGPVSDINVTPLVDVCLVLLIIFMVVLPTIVQGIPVQLPRMSTGGPTAPSPLMITVKDDGTVYLDTLVVRREQVATELVRLYRDKADRPVLVRADKRVAYGEVASILSACREAGWSDIALAGEKLRGPA